MSSRYSESEAVQKPAGELLRKMGWDLVYAYDDERLGRDGTLGRADYREVVLRRDLIQALVELNEWLDVEECKAAADTLVSVLSTDSPLQVNEKKYAMLRDGIPVERRRSDGIKYTEYAQVSTSSIRSSIDLSPLRRCGSRACYISAGQT